MEQLMTLEGFSAGLTDTDVENEGSISAASGFFF
jgi:hypothetical protein